MIKPFSIEAFKNDSAESGRVETRDGRRVTDLTLLSASTESGIWFVGVIVRFDGSRCVSSWRESGRSMSIMESPSDLVIVVPDPPKVETWFNFYGNLARACEHMSLGDAVRARTPNCLRIEKHVYDPATKTSTSTVVWPESF